MPTPHDPASVTVPPYLPDVPEVRRDLALYYDEIARLDGYVGQVVTELERQGVAEHTLIMFLSDNGRPFPRDKTTLYDSGIRTPLIVSWPTGVTPGGRSSSLVSTVDVAPTVLELAGVHRRLPSRAAASHPSCAIPAGRFATRSLRKRTGTTSRIARAVRTSRFKYIRNFYDDLPLTPPADAVRSPSFEALKRRRDGGKLTLEQRRVFAKPRPAEELYDTDADTHELRNLAGEAAHAATLKQLRATLEAWQEATDDAAPAARTPDEFDREAGTPLPTRKRPRPAKKDMVLAVPLLAPGADSGAPAHSRAAAVTLIGRWDLVVQRDDEAAPSWLEVERSGSSTLVGRFVGSGGSARPIVKIELTGNTFRFAIPPQ